MGTVYLLHFEPPYFHARHYLGYCDSDDPSKRILQHVKGIGAKLTRAAMAAGCRLVLVALWHGERSLERRLKVLSRVSRHCRLCKFVDAGVHKSYGPHLRFDGVVVEDATDKPRRPKAAKKRSDNVS